MTKLDFMQDKHYSVCSWPQYYISQCIVTPLAQHLDYRGVDS